MRNKFIKSLFAFVLLLLSYGCSTNNENIYQLPENFGRGAFAAIVSSEGSTDVNKLEPTSSSFSNTYMLVSPSGGDDITDVSVYVRLDGVTQTAEALLYSFGSSSFTSGATEYPEVTIDFDGGDIVSALGIDPSALEGGDFIRYRLAVTNAEGTFSTVSANFDNQSADHTFTSTVICILSIIPSGDWLVQMEDSYGDGWQSTTPNGGPGITVTLNTGEVLETGLCSPYETLGFDCVDDFSSGTGIITMPAGITSAVWNFPGDFWGEMSFSIISPNGNTVASGATGATGAGTIALNLCNE